jgi:exonuclease SbcC
LNQLRQQREQLARQLEGAPPPEAARADLERILAAIARLEEARADEMARDGEFKSARVTRDRFAAQREEAWQRLSAERDPFAALGAPLPDLADLAASWKRLVAWAAETAVARDGEAAKARDEAAQHAAERERLVREQVRACEEAGVAVDGRPPRDAALSARGGLQQEVKDLEGRIARRRDVERNLKDARRRLSVAGAVKQHFGTGDNAFEAWFLREALRELCVIASERLRELSSGAYSLDIDGEGDFVVVDHANADMRRPVKTLSGGETFLASLSLALGLSEQVAQVSPQGAAHLESLFLDEGFGTLDSETLDVVSGAVHELGATGRMVGLITHVRELADQIPVQFRVWKDGRTSRVERVEL